MKKMNKRGFTLTELVIVIVIIAILAAVLIPSMTGYVNRAKKSNAQSEASSVYTVYAAWLADDATENSYYYAINTAEDKATDVVGLTTAFAAYYATAQATTASGNKVGKLEFIAVGYNGFEMISSNNFYVYCLVTDGVASYTIGNAAGEEGEEIEALKAESDTKIYFDSSKSAGEEEVTGVKFTLAATATTPGFEVIFKDATMKDAMTNDVVDNTTYNLASDEDVDEVTYYEYETPAGIWLVFGNNNCTLEGYGSGDYIQQFGDDDTYALVSLSSLVDYVDNITITFDGVAMDQNPTTKYQWTSASEVTFEANKTYTIIISYTEE